MSAYIAYADALTPLGHGPSLWSSLLAGECGLSPAERCFSSYPQWGQSHVGALPDMPEEQRLPLLFERMTTTIFPDETRACDLLIGASSLGDLTGPYSGQPERFLQEHRTRLCPELDEARCLLISSACSSATDALGLAALAIRSGMAEVVGVLGFDTIEAGKILQHMVLGTQSSERARPFDVARSGTSFGEAGAFAIVASEAGLRRLGREPAAHIAGIGMSCDALDITAPDPTGQWPSAAIARALANAGAAADKIGYVNAHGSGTALNDRVEAVALREAFGERINEIPVSSTKGAVGHSLGATGLVEAVFALWALRDGIAPGTVGLSQPDPEIDLRVLSTSERIPNGIRAALSVTFGFGGVNSAIVLERV